MSPDTIDLSPPPVEAARFCEPPQPAPADLEEMTAGEQGALWESDRINLANCGANHYVLIQWALGVVKAFK